MILDGTLFLFYFSLSALDNCMRDAISLSAVGRRRRRWKVEEHTALPISRWFISS